MLLEGSNPSRSAKLSFASVRNYPKVLELKRLFGLARSPLSGPVRANSCLMLNSGVHLSTLGKKVF
jgi:hypothetical protein